MSDSVRRNVPGARGGEQMSDSNKSVTKSETLLSAEPSHSRNSSWNVHDGLFNEMEGFPSVSIANQGNSVTSDDHVSAQCFEGTSSPVRGAGRGEARCASRRSLTPQKTGVRGVAVRLASCEKSRRGREEDVGASGVDPVGPQAVGAEGGVDGVEAVQLDSAPRTDYAGILKRLEFMSGGCGGCTAETLQNTRLIFTRLKETLEGRGTPVGARRGGSPSVQHRTPVVGAGGRGDTATKKLTFSVASRGEGVGNVPATVGARYGGSARRVTFGRVSIDGGGSGMRPVMEGDDAGSDGFSFQTMTYSAGSTPYSGKTFGTRRSVDGGDDDRDGIQNVITKDQLASALKKSLTFAGTDLDGVGEGVEQQFSFGWDQIKGTTRATGTSHESHDSHDSHDQASTPNFSGFKAFKTTSRRFVTPPSQSRRLLELHGKARRVSSAGLSIETDHDAIDNDENTPVEADAGSNVSKLAKFSLPRRLDVTEAGTAAKDGSKHLQLSSPTEQVIRNSLKMERTKRLSSASKFNQSSS